MQRVWRPRAVDDPLRATGPAAVQRVDVAPNGWAAERCENGHFMPDSYPSEHRDWLMCACGARVDDSGFAVRAASVPLLVDLAHARAAIWWHVSSGPDVFVNDRDDEMHWGEFDAAMHRLVARATTAGARRGDENDPRYLYSAMLEENVDMVEDLFVENEFADQHQSMSDASQNGPVRYLNTRERPGSISLLARKGQFRVIACVDLWFQGGAEIRLPE